MLEGNPEKVNETELAQRSRAVLDGVYREEIATWTARSAARGNQGRATTDVANAARAATMGAVDSLLVDIDTVMPGTVDETDGSVTLMSAPSASSYGVVDEIARRVLLSGGRVLGIRKADIPNGALLAAILRYPV